MLPGASRAALARAKDAAQQAFDPRDEALAAQGPSRPLVAAEHLGLLLGHGLAQEVHPCHVASLGTPYLSPGASASLGTPYLSPGASAPPVLALGTGLLRTQDAAKHTLQPGDEALAAQRTPGALVAAKLQAARNHMRPATACLICYAVLDNRSRREAVGQLTFAWPILQRGHDSADGAKP